MVVVGCLGHLYGLIGVSFHGIEVLAVLLVLVVSVALSEDVVVIYEILLGMLLLILVIGTPEVAQVTVHLFKVDVADGGDLYLEIAQAFSDFVEVGEVLEFEVFSHFLEVELFRIDLLGDSIIIVGKEVTSVAVEEHVTNFVTKRQ